MHSRLILILLGLLLHITAPLAATTFYFVRHGQTDWNVEKRIQGHSDIPLNDRGRKEVAALAMQLKEISFNACFCSDLQRTHETALVLTSHYIQPLPIIMDSRLRERHCGKWEGYLSSDFYAAGPEAYLDLESDQALQQRVLQFLQQINNDSDSNNLVLIVTHGGVIRNLMIKVLALDCSEEEIVTENTAILALDYSQGQWSLKNCQGIRWPLKTSDLQ